MARLPLYLALLILPLAVAGQNIGAGVYALILFAQIYARRRALPFRSLWRDLKVPLVASLAYIAWGLTASALNPAMPFAESGSFAFGYIFWAMLPPVLYLAQDPLDESTTRRLQICLAVAAAVIGMLAVAQMLYGFKLVGTQFVPGMKRAQGLYSHPLTLAYVALFLVPVGWIGVLRRPRDAVSWVILASGVAAVFASQSRSVQAACAVAVVVEAVLLAKGRTRLVAIAVIVVLGAAVGLTDNAMKERFTRTVAGNYDVKSDYKDDRLAFWDVHWEMFKERPFLGHGENITTAYRLPFYEKMGLGGLERKYEAHDLYLQILVNTGVFGLALFLVWFGWAFWRAWQIAKQAIGGRMALTTLTVFAVASITQNSFQSSSVRYALTLLVSGLCLWPTAARSAELRRGL